MSSLPCKFSQSTSIRQRQAAFTFIELIIVSTIMVLVLLVGSVNYLRFLEKQRLYQVGNDIEAFFKDARNKAETGFLGSEDLGFCTQLKAVRVDSMINLDSQMAFTASLACGDGSSIVYDNYLVDQVGAVMNQTISSSFLFNGGVSLVLDGVNVDELSASITQGNYQIILQIDHGGSVNVSYQ